MDKGEASAIALALEVQKSILIIDDYRARKLAKRPQINFTGIIGVVIKAKNTGLIPSIKPLLTSIRKTDFRITNEIEQQALQLAGEVR